MLLPHALRAVQKGSAVLQYQSIGTSSSTGSATKTISLGIGTASSDRWVIVLFQWPAGENRTISSATINSVSATIGSNNTSSSTTFGNGSFFAKVTSGTGVVTISAVLSGDTNTATSGFAVYTLTGRTTLTYSGTQNQSAVATATSRTTTLTVPSNGFNLNWWISTSTPTAGTWSGTPSAPTLQSPVSQRVCSSAFQNFTASSQSVTATFSHSNSIAVRLCSTAWNYV